MKSRALMCITAMTLFAALAVSVRLRLGAQEQTKQHRHYKLIDVGTFGGPNSYTSAPLPAVQILNNQGVVTGNADTSVADPFAPNCFDPDCLVSHTFAWRNGVLTDLGALPGFNNSSGPIWINASGLIVGISEDGLVDPLTGFPEIRAVLWQDGRISSLGTLEGGNESFATAINNRGQVVGLVADTVPDPFSMFGWGAQTRAFLYEKGVMRDLGTLGGPDAIADFVNERGRIAGISYTNSTPSALCPYPLTTHPFLSENGKMLDLGTLGGTCGLTNDLNNRGQVVGQSNFGR